MKSIEIDWRGGDVSIDGVKEQTTIHTTEVNGQLLNVVVADASNEYNKKPTIIWPQAFMARALDPIEIYRTQVLAKQLGTKVVSVDRPGVRYDPTYGEYTEAGSSNFINVLQAATTGNLDNVSAVQLGAVDKVIEFEKNEELHLIGYSFGAWSASSMATALGKEPFGSARQPVISGVTLIEAANDQPHPLNILRKSLAADSSNENLSRYLAQNELLGANDALFFDWQSASERSVEGTRIHAALDRKQALSLYLPALGLRKGFSTSLCASSAMGLLQDVKVTFVRADGSLVARRSAHEKSVADIAAAQRGKAKPELIELTPPDGEQPHRHPIVHSMGAVAVLVDTVLTKLPDLA